MLFLQLNSKTGLNSGSAYEAGKKQTLVLAEYWLSRVGWIDSKAERMLKGTPGNPAPRAGTSTSERRWGTRPEAFMGSRNIIIP